jgi:hypothetical protein
MDRMSQERFDEWVKSAAQDYNRPPDIPPRDAMWEAIEAAGHRPKAEGANLASRSAPLGASLGLRPRDRLRSALTWFPLAAAAMLLLAAGIGVGYWMRGGAPGTVATAPTPNATNPPRAAVTQAPSPGTGEPAIASAPDSQRSPAGVSTGYDVLATQHLNSAEVLLTSFRSANDTSMDEITRRFARDLLSTTRLLLDSPAGSNPVRRRLLEDLELVLVQMAQVPSQGGSLDRELIDRAISRRQVLTRIRTSIAAGSASGT